MNTTYAPKPPVGRSSPDLTSELCIHTSTPHVSSPLGHLTRSGNSVHADELFSSEPPNSLSPCFPPQDVNLPHTQLLKPETWESFSVPLVPSPSAHSSQQPHRPKPHLDVTSVHSSPNAIQPKPTSPHIYTSPNPSPSSIHASARMVFLGPKFHQASLQPKIPQWLSSTLGYSPDSVPTWPA